MKIKNVKISIFMMMFLPMVCYAESDCNIENLMKGHYLVRVGDSYFPMPKYYSLTRFGDGLLNYSVAIPARYTDKMIREMDGLDKKIGHVVVGKIDGLSIRTSYKKSTKKKIFGVELNEKYFELPMGDVRVIWIVNADEYIEFSSEDFESIDVLIKTYACLNKHGKGRRYSVK